MGRCCCWPSKKVESPSYLPYPLSEEVEPLSLHTVSVSNFSNGLLVDKNLNNSVPDTLHAPPASVTCEIRIGQPRLPSSCEENPGNKSKVASRTLGELLEDVNSSTTFETKVKKLEANKKAEINIELADRKAVEDESLENFKKFSEPLAPPLQEEECPTCLEEYDFDNPKIVTKCNHNFHLACILEWMERSNTCPVCDQEMIFSDLTVV